MKIKDITSSKDLKKYNSRKYLLKCKECDEKLFIYNLNPTLKFYEKEEGLKKVKEVFQEENRIFIAGYYEDFEDLTEVNCPLCNNSIPLYLTYENCPKCGNKLTRVNVY